MMLTLSVGVIGLTRVFFLPSYSLCACVWVIGVCQDFIRYGACVFCPLACPCDWQWPKAISFLFYGQPIMFWFKVRMEMLSITFEPLQMDCFHCFWKTIFSFLSASCGQAENPPHLTKLSFLDSQLYALFQADFAAVIGLIAIIITNTTTTTITTNNSH